jgi:hypothetical protein
MLPTARSSYMQHVESSRKFEQLKKEEQADYLASTLLKYS